MTRVVVTGAAGRMGKAIIQAVFENPEAELSGAIEMDGHKLVGKDAGEVSGVGRLGVKITSSLEKALAKADVVIDFSMHEASIGIVEETAGAGKAVVIGTTGYSPSQREKVKELSKTSTIVMAPNMSVGVNLLIKLVELATSVLKDDYDIEILDMHHRHKKDAPSGTALRLGEAVSGVMGKALDDVAVYERKGIIGERADGELGIQTVRAGDIVGDHTVLFAGPGERLELTHRAHSRSTFATGAVKAAVWVAGRPNGFYDMQDVLGLSEKKG